MRTGRRVWVEGRAKPDRRPTPSGVAFGGRSGLGEVSIRSRTRIDDLPGLHISDHQTRLYMSYRQRLGVEGVISKRVDRPYLPGNRKLWLKSKCLNREEFVVVGWTDPGGGRSHFGALLLGYYTEDGRLHYAGRAGTGFTDASHSAVSVSLTVAPYLRRRSRAAPTSPGITISCCRRARSAVLAMPACRRAQLVEDAPFLRPFGRPVTLRHRRHHLAPCPHADLPAIEDTDLIR
jgi:hypothetical protein